MYEMQIKMHDESTSKMIWKPVRPTNGQPYKYDTEQEALRMLLMCYPGIEHADSRRVVDLNG